MSLCTGIAGVESIGMRWFWVAAVTKVSNADADKGKTPEPIFPPMPIYAADEKMAVAKALSCRNDLDQLDVVVRPF